MAATLFTRETVNRNHNFKGVFDSFNSGNLRVYGEEITPQRTEKKLLSQIDRNLNHHWFRRLCEKCLKASGNSP